MIYYDRHPERAKRVEGPAEHSGRSLGYARDDDHNNKTTCLVSRILFLNHHLSGRNITVAILLPTLELRRAVFKRSYTWHYSTQGLPSHTVTSMGCELLPHIFTFTPFEWSSYFLWHYLFPFCNGSRLFTGGLPFAVRTFLPVYTGRWFGQVEVQRYRI